MNWKFTVSAAVMFVMLFALGWAIHGTLLAPDYAKIPSLVRPMAEVRGNFLYMLLAQLLTAIAFTWIYRKGRRTSHGWRRGCATALPSPC
jgi:hypothetical protein